jgi:hypothetical protein
VLITLCYAIVGLVVARRVYSYMILDEFAPLDGKNDYVMLAILAFAMGILWPLGILVAIIMYKPKKDKIKELHERIWELEDLNKMTRSKF